LFIVANLVLNKHKLLGIEELEINLSPKLQQVLFEKIKTHVHRDSDLASQVIITSHSDYFSKRMDVRCYGVEHNGAHTVVAKWTAAREKEFFSR
jgi:predicted ATP-dependent endonuclease of OLD family